ncbi:class D sortase [Agrilactobacillus fermenti]|uniref:class D sortase n=1 Tax=Agrilactobacillus fermenti TaxID=2586909 RepID=UPI003A5BC889
MAYFYMPLLFLVIGYGVFFLAARPILDFVHNTVHLITLDRPPKFSAEKTTKSLKLVTANQQQTLKMDHLKLPTYGDQFGQLTIPAVGLEQPLYFGDGEQQLAKGVGMYNGSRFPGERGTTLVAGHNVTAMHNLNQVQVGQQIVVRTSYGVYTYGVTKKLVAKYNDAQAFDLSGRQPKLILYTCYPIDMVGLTPDRLVVYGSLQSGPIIKM